MPTFSQRPSSNLSTSLRNLAASSNTAPTWRDEVAIDAAIASQQRNLSLAQKARLEVEQAQRAQAMREDPNLPTEFAAHTAGINLPEASRLRQHIQGVMEEPSVADIDDAARMGAEPTPYVTAAPNLQPGQESRFRSALAAEAAARMATGKTQPLGIAQAAGETMENALMDQAARAASVEEANRLGAVRTGRPYLPYARGEKGTVLQQATGELAEGGQLAGAERGLIGQRARTEVARQAELRQRGALSAARAKTEPARAEFFGARATAVKEGRPTSGRPPSPLAPERITHMIELSANREFKTRLADYDALPRKERQKAKRPTYAEVRREVEARYRNKAKAVDVGQERQDAREAIMSGRDPAAVRSRYKERTGIDLDDEEED